MKAPAILALGLVAALVLPGCVSKRTTYEGGQKVDSHYVIKRPVRNAVENLQVE